jgi:hypothetical protein
MRWRGLALPRVPGLPIARPPRAAWRSPHRRGGPIAQPPPTAWRLPRLPDKPIAQMSCSARRHRCQIPAIRASLPTLAAIPRFPLGRIPSSVVRDFYCQSSELHKGLSARTSRFFSHPQDICCLSPIYGRFPLRRAQACPQDLGIISVLQVSSVPGLRSRPGERDLLCLRRAQPRRKTHNLRPNWQRAQRRFRASRVTVVEGHGKSGQAELLEGSNDARARGHRDPQPAPGQAPDRDSGSWPCQRPDRRRSVVHAARVGARDRYPRHVRLLDYSHSCRERFNWLVEHLVRFVQLRRRNPERWPQERRSPGSQ